MKLGKVSSLFSLSFLILFHLEWSRCIVNNRQIYISNIEIRKLQACFLGKPSLLLYKT